MLWTGSNLISMAKQNNLQCTHGVLSKSRNFLDSREAFCQFLDFEGLVRYAERLNLMSGYSGIGLSFFIIHLFPVFLSSVAESRRRPPLCWASSGPSLAPRSCCHKCRLNNGPSLIDTFFSAVVHARTLRTVSFCLFFYALQHI